MLGYTAWPALHIVKIASNLRIHNGFPSCIKRVSETGRPQASSLVCERSHSFVSGIRSCESGAAPITQTCMRLLLCDMECWKFSKHPACPVSEYLRHVIRKLWLNRRFHKLMTTHCWCKGMQNVSTVTHALQPNIDSPICHLRNLTGFMKIPLKPSPSEHRKITAT
jgi:hypothetical protein